MTFDLPGFTKLPIRLHLAFNAFIEETNRETHNRSACQLSYIRVLTTTKQLACGLKSGFLGLVSIKPISTTTTTNFQSKQSD